MILSACVRVVVCLIVFVVISQCRSVVAVIAERVIAVPPVVVKPVTIHSKTPPKSTLKAAKVGIIMHSVKNGSANDNEIK